MKKRIVLSVFSIILAISTVACNGTKIEEKGVHEETVTNQDNSDKEEDKEEKEDEEDEEETSKEDDSSNIQEESVESPEKCAMMFYMVGSDLESSTGMATVDINEVIGSNYDEDMIDVYFCLGGSEEWKNDYASSDEIRVFKLENKDMVKIDTIDTDDMTQVETLTSFVDICYEDTDCESYNMIMWDHGAGATLGFGADETADYKSMSIADMEEAFAESKLINDGNKFEVISFDACLMGMIEVAEALDDYAKYMVASEESIPGFGCDYSFVGEITNSKNLNGDNIAKIIIDSYSEFYQNFGVYEPEYSMSCLDLSKTQGVMDSFNNLIKKEIIDLDEEHYSDVARVRSKSKVFGNAAAAVPMDSVDLYNLAENFENSRPDEAKALEDSINEMVLINATNMDRTNGVAIYFPYDNKDYLDLFMESYKKLDFSSDYQLFLDGFTTILCGESLTNWDISEVYAEADEDVKGAYSIELTPEQAKTYSSCKFGVWEKNEDMHDNYLCKMMSGDAHLEGNTLIANYDGKEFYFSNGAGDQIQCTMSEYDRSDSSVIYEGYLMVYRDPDFLKAKVYVKVDAEHPNGTIVSILNDEDRDANNLYPEYNTFEFQEGDYIDGYLWGQIIKYNDDGSIQPMDKWETNTYIDEMPYDGTFTVDYKQSESEANIYLFNVHDTQGNTYVSGATIPDEIYEGATYLIDTPDSDFTRNDTYDEKNERIAIYDEYGNQVVVLNIPDGFEKEYAYTQSAWLQVKKSGVAKKYIQIYDNSLNKALVSYLNTGKIDEKNNTRDITDISSETVEVNGYDVIIVRYTSGHYEYTDVLVPYKNYFGDQCYLEINGTYINKDTSTDDIKELFSQMLPER